MSGDTEFTTAHDRTGDLPWLSTDPASVTPLYTRLIRSQAETRLMVRSAGQAGRDIRATGPGYLWGEHGPIIAPRTAPEIAAKVVMETVTRTPRAM